MRERSQDLGDGPDNASPTAPLDPMGGSSALAATGAPPSGPCHPDLFARHGSVEQSRTI